MYCKECGAEIPDDSKECGTKVDGLIREEKHNNGQHGLIVGLIGGIISFITFIMTPMFAINKFWILIGVLFSFLSIYGVYSTYKKQKYGKIILIVSIIFMFLMKNIIGNVVLIVSLVLFYLDK